MSATSNIEWTDRTWNPVVGCDRVSPGCQHCYAETMAHRLQAMGRPEYQGLVKLDSGGRPKWTGTVRFLPERLEQPLHWRKPSRVFVNSMSDLFHESVPFDAIAAVFGVIAVCRQHTFQILTKRHERALEFFEYLGTTLQPALAFQGGEACTPARACATRAFLDLPNGTSAALLSRFDGTPPPWPLPNVWLGVSVEDQQRADERIPILRKIPAAVRWLSMEPLLGPVNVRHYLRQQTQIHMCLDIEGAIRNKKTDGFTDANGRKLSRREAEDGLFEMLKQGHKVMPLGKECDAFDTQTGCPGHVVPRLDWVVVGGESGAGHRPMDPDWARSIRDQCADAGVPFFMKQMAGKKAIPEDLMIRQYPEVA